MARKLVIGALGAVALGYVLLPQAPDNPELAHELARLNAVVGRMDTALHSCRAGHEPSCDQYGELMDVAIARFRPIERRIENGSLADLSGSDRRDISRSMTRFTDSVGARVSDLRAGLN